MTDERDGTEEVEVEAPVKDTQPADEVTKLRSRNAGLDAKVTSLTQSAAAAEAARVAAEQKLADYEAKVVGQDEALRAQVDAVKAELEATRQEARLARIEAQYPETFAVLGDAAANLSPEKLAEAEARFAGVEPPVEQPRAKPIGNNPSRTAAPANAEETSADIAKRLSAMAPPWTV